MSGIRKSHFSGVLLQEVLAIYRRLGDTVPAFEVQGWRTNFGRGVLHPIPFFSLKECVNPSLRFYYLSKRLCNYFVGLSENYLSLNSQHDGPWSEAFEPSVQDIVRYAVCSHGSHHAPVGIGFPYGTEKIVLAHEPSDFLYVHDDT